MRVLIVGDIFGADLCANFHMIMQKFVHGFARAGHGVQVFNDRQAARYATPLHSRKLGTRTANARLLQACRNYRPHLVFLGHCEIIRNDTLAAVREAVPGVRIAYRNVDPIYDFDHDNHRRIASRIDTVDTIFVTTAGRRLSRFAGGRANVHFMPNPIDPNVETLRQFEQPARALPVDLFFGFMGRQQASDTNKQGDARIAIATELKQRLPEATFEIRGLDHPPVRGQDYMDAIARARMGLNFSRVNDHYLYASDRMAHYLGCGLVTLTDRATGFGELFDEDELGFYADRDELVAQIERFRTDDAARRRVAEAGWRRGHQLFDVARVARYICDTMFETGLSEAYEWPTGPAKPAAKQD
ncbi:hypothetical protein CKO28_15680 [Rhodovibrio sodomensis]|uniref:Spore protein YkvP/CgeB glycosyl transferase-like domain-containing protein n=1 Tax=Rhodovibrio sodomensis TaxID=1088 RepID=A0ABS1DGY3_9PROT|nr:glycosyltransferase [Rhodovibrio sodomensis]MBK1669479.1 hypothetical protein [Rhodovibrio sodomensis]